MAPASKAQLALIEAQKLLPKSKTLSLARTLRALDALGIKPRQFAEAYRSAGSRRGRGVSRPSEKVLRAFATYRESGDFAQFAKEVGAADTARATALLGRSFRWAQEKDSII